MALAILRRRSRSINTPPPLGALGSYLALGFWAFVVLFPLYWLAVTSLKLPIDVNSGPFYLPFADFKPTLENWRYIFVDLRDDTFRPYLNTVVIATTSTVLALVIGSMAPYRLARLQYPPPLRAIGRFLAGAALAAVPIVVWLMRDYFQSVPLELEESAAIDGASRYRIFRTIVLPLSVPGLVATFLFVLVFAWNEYLFALFLTTAKAQTLPMTVAAQNATRGPQWWYMSVLILIMIVPVIAMAIALERYIARGLLVGALKG